MSAIERSWAAARCMTWAVIRLVTARYIFGAEPTRAIALLNRDANPGVDTLTSGLLEFPGGGQLLSAAHFERPPISA